MSRTGASQELTRADIRALAARIYEPQQRIWSEGGWQCPQCREVNVATSHQCACGITRDGLPEFRERSGEVGTASWVQPLISSIGCPHPSGMNPGVALFANRSLAFRLYEFNFAGVSLRRNLPPATRYLLIGWKNAIEAVRLCLRYQVKLSVKESPKTQTGLAPSFETNG